jgi:hypothetical protein
MIEKGIEGGDRKGAALFNLREPLQRKIEGTALLRRRKKKMNAFHM